MTDFMDELQEIVDSEWERVRQGLFWKTALSRMSPELYRDTLIQVYHYTKHNAINQAVAAFKVSHKKTGLLRFMFHHAEEELGHENMTVRDLKSMGLATDEDFETSPLPATQALIGYLYYVSLEIGGVARLGYSFWAEDSYHQFSDILECARETLGLSDENMTFFIAHSNIDAKHSEEVKREIRRWVVSEEDKQNVIDVARTTIYLTGCMLDQIAEKHQKNLSDSAVA